MNEIIPVSAPLTASIAVPGSKSITNRVLLIAALAEGTSTIRDTLISDDTHYMLEALKGLGIEIEQPDEHTFIVHGTGGKFAGGNKKLTLGNAGTAVRFLTSAMTLREGVTEITGNSAMQKRPIEMLVSGLRQVGAKIKTVRANDCPPVQVESHGHFPGGELAMRGRESSQYFSSIFITSPLGDKETTVYVSGELTSKPYIDVTLQCQKDFGVEVENDNYKVFKIKPQKYTAREYDVEGDASAASYYFAIAALTGSEVTVSNVPYTSAQGDIHFVDVLEKMGCEVVKDSNNITVKGPQKLIAPGEIDMNSMPDVAMTLAVVAACAEGETLITGIHNLRIKETDRIAALAKEIQKTGIQVDEGLDTLKIWGGTPTGGEIDTYDDHRMAMCFAVLGTKVPGLKIKNPECVSKTYPHFWEDLKKIGIQVQS